MLFLIRSEKINQHKNRMDKISKLIMSFIIHNIVKSSLSYEVCCHLIFRYLLSLDPFNCSTKIPFFIVRIEQFWQCQFLYGCSNSKEFRNVYHLLLEDPQFILTVDLSYHYKFLIKDFWSILYTWDFWMIHEYIIHYKQLIEVTAN